MEIWRERVRMHRRWRVRLPTTHSNGPGSSTSRLSSRWNVPEMSYRSSTTMSYRLSITLSYRPSKASGDICIRMSRLRSTWQAKMSRLRLTWQTKDVSELLNVTSIADIPTYEIKRIFQKICLISFRKSGTELCQAAIFMIIRVHFVYADICLDLCSGNI